MFFRTTKLEGCRGKFKTVGGVRLQRGSGKLKGEVMQVFRGGRGKFR